MCADICLWVVVSYYCAQTDWKSLKMELRGGGQLPVLGAKNLTRVLCKSGMHF